MKSDRRKHLENFDFSHTHKAYCPVCNGSGQVLADQSNYELNYERCWNCDGYGILNHYDCKERD